MVIPTTATSLSFFPFAACFVVLVVLIPGRPITFTPAPITADSIMLAYSISASGRSEKTNEINN